MTRKHISISLIIRITVIFLAAYVISAVLWIQVKDSYAYLVTFIASKFVAGLKDARLEVITISKDAINTSFRSLTGNQYMFFPVSITTYVYTSNVPMTVAILASLYFFIQRKTRAMTEALLMLFIIHLLYVFSYESLQLTIAFMTKRMEEFNPLKVTVYQFLWGFTEYMFVRFGPFFIGIYIYLRFQKNTPEEI
jgi:hypothetical protein